MFDETDVARTTLVLTALFGLGSIGFHVPLALGSILGGLISFLALRLLIVDSHALLRRSRLETISPKDAARSNWRSFLKRCSLYVGALTIAILNPHLAFFGTLIGLLLPRLAIIYHLLKGRIKRGS